MPRWASAKPRKMLPPPTTTAISTFSSVRASETSSAIRCTTDSSITKPVSLSANTSPESLSTTRGYRLSGMTSALLLADLDPREPAHDRVAADRAQQLADRRLRIADEGLLDQHHVLEEPVEPALDDLGNGLLGLALVAGQLLEHRPLLVDDVLRHVVAGRVAGGGRGDVERDVVRNLACLRVGCVDPADLDEDADRAPLVLHVLVAVDHAVGALEARHPTEADVLAQLGAERLDRVGHGAAVERLGLDTVVAVPRDLAGERGHELTEVGALRHEVGLAGELDQRAPVAVDDHVDCPLLGGAPGSLLLLGDALGPQPVLGRVEVAAGLLERLLAVHHPGAGRLAQRGDVLRSHLSHQWTPLPARMSTPRSRASRRRRLPKAPRPAAHPACAS